MSSPKRSLTRRQFIRNAAAGAGLIAAPNLLTGCASNPYRVSSRVAANERVNIACIGVGNRGLGVMQGLMRDERTQIVAVCDVNAYDENGYWGGRPGGRDMAQSVVHEFYGEQKRSGAYSGCDSYEDFREVLARGDVDAVMIATPDHWHALPVIMAAEAGKDIYGEKPLSLTIHEGRLMSDAVRYNKRVFQTGSQQRSDHRFRHACELVRNGYIGELKKVTCGLPGGAGDISGRGDQTDPVPVPGGFDYDMWLGPAPEEPYCPARTHVNFRWIFDYSGGQVTDWGGHHPDIAQWGMGTEHTGPIAVRNPQAKFAEHPVYNTAIDYSFDCEYANGVTLTISSSARGGVTFEGTEGTVWANRGAIEANPASLLDVTMKGSDIGLVRSNNHARNFVDCIFTREDPVAPIEAAHRSISIAHLGNIAMRLGREILWDPETEQVKGDPEANAMISRPYREPWSLSEYEGRYQVI